MSTPKIVTSPTMYVGYQKRTEDGEEIKLGFATYLPLNDTKKQKDAYEKRKSTVDAWHETMVYDYKTRTRTASGLETNTIDNSVALDGFKIANHVRRYGWGGGNVVWRIEDPRGFELEISSANMASILDTTTLVHGVISGKCIWGWTGGKVVLLPEDSQPYKDAINTTSMETKNVAAKDVNIGDRVQLLNGTIGVWAGRLYYVEAKRQYDTGTSTDVRYSNHDGRTWVGFEPADKTSGFLVKDDGSVFVMSSPKFGKIIEANGGRDKQYGCDLVSTALANGERAERPGYGPTIVAVSTKKITNDALTVTTRPTSESIDSKRTIWWMEGDQAMGMGYGREHPVMDMELLKEGKLSPIYVDSIDELNLTSRYHRFGEKFGPKMVPFPEDFNTDLRRTNVGDKRYEYANQFPKIEVVLQHEGYVLPLINMYI